MRNPLPACIQFEPEVLEAIRNKLPVLALESTIISHGMPFPQNVHTALEVEEIVRQEGVVPATVAVIDGKLRIGLNRSEIERIGSMGSAVMKISRRDLPYAISAKKCGATTVSGTILAAAIAGIPLFATGGIGGVHRNYAETLDISADLHELSSSNVAIISSGIKSILDIPNTLELLETLGVPVIGYRTDLLPAFYSKTSSHKVDYRIDQVEAIAELIQTKWALGISGGILIANPIPDQDGMEEASIEASIQEALSEAKRLKIKGKEITPFLLKTIVEKTGGESLKSNCALIKNNARLGAKLALALSLNNKLH